MRIVRKSDRDVETETPKNFSAAILANGFYLTLPRLAKIEGGALSATLSMPPARRSRSSAWLVKGKVKEKWGKLTNDDLATINGRRDQLEGKIQQRYGYAKDQARKEVDDWYSAQNW